jgi:nucleoside 2-deoxyribosyltransferase
MKKIYFACSITGGRDHAHVYEDIVKHIKDAGMHVLSEIFADKKIKAEEGPTKHLTPHEIWKNDTAWVEEADAIIAEVTQPSLGVGFEIGYGDSLGKPILALFYRGSGRRLSPMVSGNPRITVIEYDDAAELFGPITRFVENLD